MARPCYSRGCENCPPWLTEEEHQFCLGRLDAIKEELSQMGASDEYCRTYFQRDGGFCSYIVCGQCKKHRMDQTPMPDWAMCSIEFGHQLSSLRSQVAEIKTERNRLNQELERVLLIPSTGGEDQQDPPPSLAQRMMISCTPNQARLNEVSELRNELNHLFKQLQELMGRRLALLEQDPVDTVAWHRRVSDLLTEKIELLERLKFGPSPPSPSLPLAVVDDVTAVGE